MAVQPQGKISLLWWRMAENIQNDYLEIFLITSRAGGREATQGRSFGAGKSTLAIWMAYRAFAFERGTLMFDEKQVVDLNTEEEKIKLMKHVVQNYVKWTLDDVVETIRTTDKLIPAIVWDDTQYSCPAYTHIPPKVREKIEYLTRVRQRVANIILTAPSMGEIAKPLREHVNWEIIVPTRGKYEIQFVDKMRDFYNPVRDKSRLWYDVTGFFDPLPYEVDIFYKQLRDAHLNRVVEEEHELIEPVTLPNEVLEKIRQLHQLGYTPAQIAFKVKVKEELVTAALATANKKEAYT